MKIMNVGVKNFRSLKCIDIPFENMTILVGKNGVGKSSVLKAIDVFFNSNHQTTIEDYYAKNTNEQIEITIIFGEFTSHEEKLYDDYISNNKLIVSKRISLDNRGEYYCESNQIPEFAAIRKIQKKLEIQKSIRELMASNQFDGLEGSFKSADKGLIILKQYEQNHPELTKLMERSFQPKGGSIDDFTKFILLPAVKEATDEIGDRSPIGQMIDAIVEAKIRNRDDLIDFAQDINKQISATYSPDKLGGLQELATDITKALQTYSPTSELKINWGEMRPTILSVPPVLYSLVEDNFEGDISKKGHGLQRSLILTLIEYFAKITPEIEGEDKVRVDLIIALEEPEIYLHPSRCHYLAKTLSEIAERGAIEPSQSRIQIMYSTHSPYFVGFDRFDNIRILRKSPTKIPFTTSQFYSLEKAATVYSEICGTHRRDITREHFRVKTVPLMKAIANEGFFADMIILCEGVTDIAVLWKLQEIMGKEWEKMSMALIPCGGNGSIVKPGIIFKGLGIPIYMVFDLDGTFNVPTQRILKFLDQPPELPTEYVHPTWACEKIKLEVTLEDCVGTDNYKIIWDEVSTKIEIPRGRINKNEEAYSIFTEIAYDKGFKLEPYERIVNSITDYYQSKHQTSLEGD